MPVTVLGFGVYHGHALLAWFGDRTSAEDQAKRLEDRFFVGLSIVETMVMAVPGRLVTGRVAGGV